MPVLREQLTATGRVLPDKEEFIRLAMNEIYPWRYRILDANGEIIFEEVVRQRSDVYDIRRRARGPISKAMREIRAMQGRGTK